MTSRELRKQRREQERQARKLEYQQSRTAAASAQEICGVGSLAGEPVARPALSPGERSSSALAPNPELLDEFSADELAEMMALRARIHARAGIGTQKDEPAVLACKARLLQHLSDAKTPERPGPTGPTSPEGKAISSGNSLKHGLASGRVIIPGEDPAAFEALLSDLINEHAPTHETESLLVQQMAQSWWLMQRAVRLQNEAFTETRLDTHKLALFLRYQTTHERAFYRALNTLLKLNRARTVRSTSAPVPQQAVSSRRSSLEFVSQKSVGARHASPISQKIESAPEFVSQNGAQSQSKIEFVSQNEPRLTAES